MTCPEDHEVHPDLQWCPVCGWRAESPPEPGATVPAEAMGPGAEALRDAREWWWLHGPAGCGCDKDRDPCPVCAVHVFPLAALLEARDRAAFERGWREGVKRVFYMEDLTADRMDDYPPPAGAGRAGEGDL